MGHKELTTEEKEALKRLESMGEYDIVDMDDRLLWKLACGFRFPSIIRAMVEKGHNKRWKENIFNKLKKKL